jgi:hypothetical protein
MRIARFKGVSTRTLAEAVLPFLSVAARVAAGALKDTAARSIRAAKNENNFLPNMMPNTPFDYSLEMTLPYLPRRQDALGL